MYIKNVRCKKQCSCEQKLINNGFYSKAPKSFYKWAISNTLFYHLPRDWLCKSFRKATYCESMSLYKMSSLQVCLCLVFFYSLLLLTNDFFLLDKHMYHRFQFRWNLFYIHILKYLFGGWSKLSTNHYYGSFGFGVNLLRIPWG